MLESLVAAAQRAGTPAERARLAHAPMADLAQTQVALSALRAAAVLELRNDGWSWREVGALLGIHRNRAAHLLDP